MGKNTVILDEEARQLFAKLGGIDQRDIPGTPALSGIIGGIDEDEEFFDRVRINLIELVHLLAGYFKNVGYRQENNSHEEFFDRMTRVFAELSEIDHTPETIMIRYRGFTSGGRPGYSRDEDYVLEYGSLMLDADVTAKMVQRLGLKMHHLNGRLKSGFHLFSGLQINTLYIRLPGQNTRGLRRLFTALRILSRFDHASRNNAPIVIRTPNGTHRFPLIANEHGNPDPNFTLLAAFNNLKPAVVNALVKKLKEHISRPGAAGSRLYHANAYAAAFDIPSLRNRLVRPPVEINNVQWMVVDSQRQLVSREKADFASFVFDRFKHSPLHAPRVLHAVYGKDFRKIDAENFGERIEVASDLLKTIDKAPDGMDLVDEVHENLKERFNSVRNDVLDHIDMEADRVRIRSGRRVLTIDHVHGLLLKLLAFTKRRSVTRRKIKAMMQETIDFDTQDYEVISEEFNIPVSSARALIELIRACFDEQGRFIRSRFEKSIPEFARHEKKVFEFLWHYLKETPRRNDRVSFLNSLQLLIAELHRPAQAMRTLLDDFLSAPDAVRFEDRNALILANLLLRKYNKEINIDIEMTPEEVLLVRDGLDRDVVTAAARMIDSDPELLFRKMKAMRKMTIRALEGITCKDDTVLPWRFLFSMKREFYIFIALAGGRTAGTIIRNALRFYGDLDSCLYGTKHIKRHIPTVLQHLKVLIRGTGRVGSQKDVPALNKILDRQEDFKNMGRGRAFNHLVGRIIELAENTRYTLVEKAAWTPLSQVQGTALHSGPGGVNCEQGE